jgi:hypothetical protein
MDLLVTAAARALKAGDLLGALKRIALWDDAPALALRGIAMAQLGELAKARVLLRRAARSFGPKERVERARCVTAEAEVALASENPCRRHRFFAGRPASASRRNRMIYSSEKRFFIVRIPHLSPFNGVLSLSPVNRYSISCKAVGRQGEMNFWRRWGRSFRGMPCVQ